MQFLRFFSDSEIFRISRNNSYLIVVFKAIIYNTDIVQLRRLEQLQKNPLSYVEEHTVSRQKVAMVETRQIDSSPYFKYLDECIEWCSKKLKQITEAEYGNDLPSVQAELNLHMREHNSIEQFHSRCEQCINAKYNLTGEELAEYTQNLNTLSSTYTDLLSTSNKRMSGLETLQDFLQSATNILNWLKEKEEIEVTRDWSDTELNLANVEQYYRVSSYRIFFSVCLL